MITEYYIPSRLHGIVNFILERKMDHPGKFTFFPGWECEILFRLEGSESVHLTSSRISIDDNALRDNFCFISGLTTESTKVQFDKMHFISIVMNPIALKALFQIPTYLVNNIAILGEDYIPELQETEERLNSSPDFLSKAHWLEQHTVNRINESAELRSVFGIYNLVLKLARADYEYRPKQIEELLGYSKAQSFRIFREWFGLSISKFLKLMKFIHTVDHLHQNNEPLTRVGYNLGYYDQSHFIRTFKEFTGITPKQYLKVRSDSPGVIPI